MVRVVPEPVVGLAAEGDPILRASTVLDVDILKTFETVRSDDGSNIVIELIDLYLSSAPQSVEEIRNAAAREEWSVVKRLAHNLKGSSGTLGLYGVANICQQLEDMSTCGAFGDTLLEAFESRFAEAQDALIAERRRLTR